MPYFTAEYDSDTSLDKFHIDPQTGYLRVKDVPITCSGVRKYSLDGKITNVAKVPDEIFSPVTVASANNKPITDDHPQANGHKLLVNRENSHIYQKGWTGDNAHVANGKLYNDLIISDSNLIDEIRHGKQELSIGFEYNLDPTKGNLDGVDYDAKQRNIRINHVAVVQRGRAGHGVSFTADAIEDLDDTNDEKKGNQMDFTSVPTKDGGNIRVAVEDAYKLTKIIGDADDSQSQLDKLKAERDKLNKKIADLEDENTKSKKDAADSKKKADESKAEADSALEKNKELKSQLEGDAFEQRIADTLTFRENAKKIVGDSYDFTGKTEREVQEDALHTKYKDKDFSKESDDYVRAYYENMFNTNAGQVAYGRNTEQDSSEESKYAKALEARNHLYKGGE